MANSFQHGLEVNSCADLEIAPQPDPNKYYIGIKKPKDDAIGQRHQPSHSDTESHRPRKVFWTLAMMAVICLAIGSGTGLGLGLANQHKSKAAT